MKTYLVRALLICIVLTGTFVFDRPTHAQACDITVPAASQSALVSALETADATSGTTVICLTESTYIIDRSGTDGPTSFSFKAALPHIYNGQIVIEGNGATIMKRTSFEGTLFSVPGETASLTLRNVTMDRDSGSTGGFVIARGRLTLEDSRFQNNLGRYTWAALTGYGNTTITRSRIVNNTISQGSEGGAVRNIGTMTISESIFEGNGVGSIYGTAINNVLGELTITDSIFLDNDGNAIYSQRSSTSQPDAKLTVSNSCFFDSTPDDYPYYIDARSWNEDNYDFTNNWWGASDGLIIVDESTSDRYRDLYLPVLTEPPFPECPVLPPEAIALSQVIDYQTPTVIPLAGQRGVQPFTQFTIVTPPQLGTLAEVEGEYVYTSDASFFVGETDFFTYTVTDSQGVTSEPARVDLRSTTDLQLTDTSLTLDYLPDRAPIPFQMPFTGTLEPFEVGILVAPAHGELNGVGQDWTYTPRPSHTGYDSFLLHVTDAAQNEFVTHVGLSLDGLVQADPYQLVTLDYEAGFEPLPFELNITGGDAPYRIDLNNLPDKGRVYGSGTQWNYVPDVQLNSNEDMFSYTVYDASGFSINGSIRINLQGYLRAIGEDSVTTAYETPVAFELPAVGGTAPVMFSNVQVIEPDDADIAAAISGAAPNLMLTPPAGFSGVITLSYDVSDADGFTDSGTFQVQVDEPLALADFTAVGLDAAEQQFPITVTGGRAPYTYDLITPPEHGTARTSVINDEAQVLYQADASYNGADRLVVQVTDVYGANATATYTLSTQPPLAMTTTIPTVTQDVPYSGRFTAQGGHPPYAFEVTSLPTNGAIVTDADTFTYTPNAGYTGSDSFGITVTDSKGFTAVSDLSLSIESLHVANNPTFRTGEGLSVHFDRGDLTENGWRSGDYRLLTPPQNGLLRGVEAPSGPMVYLPNAGFVGTDTFTIEVTDTTFVTPQVLQVPVTIEVKPAVTVPAGNTAALIAALETARASDDAGTTIALGGSTYTFTERYEGFTVLPPIDFGLRLVGNGSTLEVATYIARFMDVTSRIRLEDVTFEGGNSDYNSGDSIYGGAIRNISGTIELFGVVFKENNSAQSGAIYNQGSLYIINSTFEDNFSNRGSGGGAITNFGYLYAENTDFIGNFGYWGTLVMYEDADNVVVNSYFADNGVGSFFRGTVATTRFDSQLQLAYNCIYPGEQHSAEYPQLNAESGFIDANDNWWSGTIYERGNVWIDRTLNQRPDCGTDGTPLQNVDLYTEYRTPVDVPLQIIGALDAFEMTATDPQNGQLESTNDGYTYTPDADFNGADSFTLDFIDKMGRSRSVTFTVNVAAPSRIQVADAEGLVDAIHAANADDDPTIIELSPGTYTLTEFYGDSVTVLPVITTPVLIFGNGAVLETSLQAANPDVETYLLKVDPYTVNHQTVTQGDVLLTDLTISNQYGTGVYNRQTVRVQDVTLQGNARNGIRNNGDLVMEDSQFVDNGIGVYSEAIPKTIVRNSTFEQNETAVYIRSSHNDGVLLEGNRIVGNANTNGVASVVVTNQIFSTQITMSGNCVYGNSAPALQAPSLENTIQASGNWWGAPNGPAGDYNGNGEVIYGDIDASAHLTEPPTGCEDLSGIRAYDIFREVLPGEGATTFALPVRYGQAPYTLQSVTGNDNGGVTTNGLEVTYTPNANVNVTETLLYTVQDASGEQSTGTITIEVGYPVPIVVDTTAQEYPSEVNGNCTLAEAIRAANTDKPVDGCAAGRGDDQIVLQPGTYEFTTAAYRRGSWSSTALGIESNIVIQGNDAVLTRPTTGTNSFRFFWVDIDAHLGLKDMTLQNGRMLSSGSDGGAIYSLGSLTIENVVFRNNEATSEGSAVMVDRRGGTSQATIIRDSVFEGNSGKYNALMVVCGTLDVENTRFSDNIGISTLAIGACQYDETNPTPAKLDGIVFENGHLPENENDNNGVVSIGGFLDVTMSSIIFRDNAHSLDVYLYESELTISQSCLTNGIDAIGSPVRTYQLTNNWWNSVTGPAPGGYGAPLNVTDAVYDPFLTAPPLDGCEVPLVTLPDVTVETGYERQTAPIQMSVFDAPAVPEFTYSEAQNGVVTGELPDTLVYTPNVGFSGEDFFTVTVANVEGVETIATVTVIVAPPLESVTRTVGVPKNLSMSIPRTAPGGLAPFTFGEASPPQFGTLTVNPNNNTFLYTPNPDYTGPDAFSYTVTDVYGDVATVTVQLQVGLPIEADELTVVAYKNQEAVISFPILGGTAPFTVAVQQEPQHGTLSPDSEWGFHPPSSVGGGGAAGVTPSSFEFDGETRSQLYYRPDPDYTGEDEIVLTVVDAVGETAQQLISIQVADELRYESISPARNATQVPTRTDLEVTFNQPVIAGEGFLTVLAYSVGPLTVHETIDVQSDQVQIDGNVVTIDLSNHLPPLTYFSVEFGAGTFVTPDGVQAASPYYGWSFWTDQEYPPTVISTLPADGATDVAIDATLTISFSEPVNISGDYATVTCDGQMTTFTGDQQAVMQVVLMPTLANNQQCEVILASAAIQDTDGTALDGDEDGVGSGDYTFGFTTAPMFPDFDGDGQITPADAIYQINRLGSGDLSGDVNGDGQLDDVDVAYTISQIGEVE